jgi:hypothetical protein
MGVTRAGESVGRHCRGSPINQFRAASVARARRNSSGLVYCAVFGWRPRGQVSHSFISAAPTTMTQPAQGESLFSQVSAGDSAAQRGAESVILLAASFRLGVELHKRRITLPNFGFVELDGASDDLSVLCEAWAHVGPPKSAQKHKVMTDALKLVFVESLLVAQGQGPCRKLLAFGDEAAAQFFMRKTWMAGALRSLGVEVDVFALPDEVRSDVQAAQVRQFR